MTATLEVTRRDFLNGVLLAAASTGASAQAAMQGQTLELAAAAHRLREQRHDADQHGTRGHILARQGLGIGQFGG